jgi:hypothetical protein
LRTSGHAPHGVADIVGDQQRPRFIDGQADGNDGLGPVVFASTKENSMTDFRDIHRDGNNPVSQHGVNDPVSGVDVKHRFHDNASPHERDQWAADVRADSSPDDSEEFLPEALRRSPTAALNKRTGRNPAK